MSKSPLLERRSPLKITYGLLILTAFFFLLPSAFRAARLSLGTRENDVKDWLPPDFAETAELEWFAQHFAGEAFVLATWEGCNGDDQRLKLLTQKLLHESASYDPAENHPPKLAAMMRRAKQVGNELQLIQGGDKLTNWGGENEKWLKSASGDWYYVKPDGGLYRWDQPLNAPMAAVRKFQRSRGTYQLDGQFITGFGKLPGNERGSMIANPIYNDPSLLCASLFETVQTGYSIVEELASEGGPLWPIDLTDPSKRATVAERDAMERLTGMLFAPAVPKGFDWTAEAFRGELDDDEVASLPEDFDTVVATKVKRIVEESFDGSLESLASAPEEEKADAWYAVWDSVSVPAPPRLTCVLVTLTDLAKDNLGYAIGRGVLGQPRGRLLQLADESGVYAARPPSMAPPPFNKDPQTHTAAMPALRLGGPTVDNMAIDEEGTVTLARLVGYSILIGVVLSYLCFRSVKITIMIFVVGGSSAMLSMAMVWWTGGHVDAILMSMPSLVYVLGLSGAIHMINYYRDEVRVRGKFGAAGRALQHAVLPCTLASFTTAIGLISLFTSNLAPISNFGLYSAVGVMSTLGILFSYLPAALQVFSPKVGDPNEDAPPDAPRVESQLSQWWASVGRTIANHHVLVTTACLLFMVACGIGMRQIKTSVQLLELFDSRARIIRDYAWLEENFGKLVPMEVVVRMPKSIQADAVSDDETPVSPVQLGLLERVEAVSRIRKVVHRTLGEPGMGVVGQATGADTFLPTLPEPSNSYSPVRAKFNRELLAAQDQLRNNDYLKIEKSGELEGSELWRISLRVAALSDVDYGQFITTVRESVAPVLRAYETREEIVEVLTDQNTGKLKRGSKVLIVGAPKPASLDQTELVSDDHTQILARNTYLATLGELLAGERIESPRWLSLTPEKTRELLASDRWTKVLSEFDVVVWAGGDGFAQSNFASAKNLLDVRGIETKPLEPKLLADRVPGVEGGGSVQAIYTGVIPVVYKAQRTLLTSLADSIALAFALIAVVMIVLLNPGSDWLQKTHPRNLMDGLAAGCVAMIPNIFPVVVIFGLMCHMGLEIDIGTMMTASVAMGVAVDDTIHFLSWFRENLDRGKSRAEAVIETYRRVGPAMTQTTVVGGLGLFVFALSTFTPTQRFGTLMLMMLFAALVGDLILLPALLAGPLGRFFKPRLDKNGVPIHAESTHLNFNPSQDAAGHQAATVGVAGDQEENSGKTSDVEGIPQLKVHFPAERADRPHPINRK
ncbi:MMPL family protein [Rubripirellula amarantea]|uniref:MMPL family protein n=1 Tax=Rubripirellula amarantea TaxID=2527999 RepID=A0A5C5WTW4_9BACT|nr:MMPL family transporter [Rubripirellula amarantea]TWT54008.1 MMPL family protein [Rubripirellula amarantea]